MLLRLLIQEGMVPCIILNGMGQASTTAALPQASASRNLSKVVRVNVGRPRRGKGLLVKREAQLLSIVDSRMSTDSCFSCLATPTV